MKQILEKLDAIKNILTSTKENVSAQYLSKPVKENIGNDAEKAKELLGEIEESLININLSQMEPLDIPQIVKSKVINDTLSFDDGANIIRGILHSWIGTYETTAINSKLSEILKYVNLLDYIKNDGGETHTKHDFDLMLQDTNQTEAFRMAQKLVEKLKLSFDDNAISTKLDLISPPAKKSAITFVADSDMTYVLNRTRAELIIKALSTFDNIDCETVSMTLTSNGVVSNISINDINFSEEPVSNWGRRNRNSERRQSVPPRLIGSVEERDDFSFNFVGDLVDYCKENGTDAQTLERFLLRRMSRGRGRNRNRDY